MEVSFDFIDNPLEEYCDHSNPEWIKANESIYDKIVDKIIEIPCAPTKEMKVDMLSFADTFNLTDDEIEWLSDDPYFYIIGIYIEPHRIRIMLSLDKNDQV